MTVISILQAAFSPSSQQLKSVIFDVLWRSLWAILSFFAVMIFGAGVMGQLGSLTWEGPDLGPGNPIMVLAALQQFWNEYGMILLAASGFLLLALVGLWLILEALFRGGLKGFWIYLGTGAARTALLFGTAMTFITLSTRDEGGGTLLIGLVVILGIWYIAGSLETVVRRDAVELLATDFLKLSAVMAWLRLTELVLAFLILGSAATAVLRASDTSLATLWFGVVLLFWMILQSYLVAVRYSAIDIMRRNVVRG
jgi:hypothetical protein